MKPRVPASKYKSFMVFVDFLKSNNAMSYFDYCYGWIFEMFDIDRWIAAAFEWDKSPEAGDFWHKINQEWLNKLQGEQNQ